MHPRRVDQPASRTASKLGGMILWPRDEAWPVCVQPSFNPASATSEGLMNDPAVTQPHNCPFEAVLQLRKDDFPGVPFPRGTDLVQFLWCPHQHLDLENDAEPGYRIFWRRERDILHSLEEAPGIEDFPTRQQLFECTFHPEPYIDYPDYSELDDATREAVNQWHSPAREEECRWVAPEASLGEIVSMFAGTLPATDMDWLRESWGEGAQAYREGIGAVPGTKLFGYPAWVQGPEYELSCPQGHEMRFLGQWDTTEFGLDQDARWCPIEDQALAPTGELSCPHGVMLGDTGRLYLFICTKCGHRPVRFFHQCF